VFFLTGAPGFGVEAGAHLEEEAFGVVGAAHVERGYPPTATAVWTDVFTLALPTLGGVLGSVWSPPSYRAQKLRVTRGAATWASTAAKEEAFGGTEVPMATVGSEAEEREPFGV